jgi:hypothetical protein
MKRAFCGVTLVTALAAGSGAMAANTLQMDMNALGLQTTGSGGAPSGFGGLSHTGAINLSFASGISYMAGIFVDSINQNFSGSLTGMTGTIQLSNGQVVGGSLSVTVNGVDTYTAQLAQAGYVETYIGGGYTVQGLTVNGMFSSNSFGNVNVTPWAGGSLTGSFLQFNFNPTAHGNGFADMDLFVNVVPLPPAVYTGLASLGGLMLLGYYRRKN